MRVLLLAAALSVAPRTEVVERWPDGAVKVEKRYGESGALEREVVYYVGGAKWSERVWADGGVVRLGWSTSGWLEQRVPLDARGTSHGAFFAYGRDGGVVKEGRYEHGLETGRWLERDDEGRLMAQRDFDGGRVVASVSWYQGRKHSELSLAGDYVEYEEDGALAYRRTAAGLHERWMRDGGRHSREQLKGGELLLLDAWDEQGRQVVKSGAGARIEHDGELGFPYQAVYRGGVRVSRNPLPGK